VLVEGNMDVVASHQAGVKAVVAASGDGADARAAANSFETHEEHKAGI